MGNSCSSSQKQGYTKEISKKKVLNIVAHPNVDKSFSHQLSLSSKEFLESNGHEVKVIDLYKMNWNPVEGPHDFINQGNDIQPFDYLQAQLNATINQNSGFTAEIKEQIENILWADVIIFNFPFYWYSTPAIILGYIKRVFAYGLAYGPQQQLKGKKWLLAVTTGGPAIYYNTINKKNVKQLIIHFNELTPKLFGMERLPIFISYATKATNSQSYKNSIKKQYQDHLSQFI